MKKENKCAMHIDSCVWPACVKGRVALDKANALSLSLANEVQALRDDNARVRSALVTSHEYIDRQRQELCDAEREILDWRTGENRVHWVLRDGDGDLIFSSRGTALSRRDVGKVFRVITRKKAHQ
jgi:hypothetical protein